ncbi:MAG: hypothetical protein JXR91_09235, partial [Deltaproteobacteria bacterium]|nr:hypothetical protein [Deltaproteobacteria bacterium]
LRDFFNKLKKNIMFQKFAKEINKTDIKDISPYTYFMRNDGALIFCTAILAEKGEPLFLGEPVRFPRLVEIDTLARREVLFGMPFYSITKVCDQGSMENAQEVQKREVNKIIEASYGELYGFETRPYYGGAVFRMEDLAYAFTCRLAYKNAIDVNNKKVQEVTEWITGCSGIETENLGMTGSGVFGIIDAEDEDVDMVYYASLEKLLIIRNEIRSGVLEGRFAPLNEFGKIWPLRIWLSPRVQQCPFFVLSNPEESFMHNSEIKITEWYNSFEFKVVDDSLNMISPIILKIGDVKIDGKEAPSYPLVINNTFYRGDFYNNYKIKSEHCAHIKIKKSKGVIIDAYLIVEWNVMTVLRD